MENLIEGNFPTRKSSEQVALQATLRILDEISSAKVKLADIQAEINNLRTRMDRPVLDDELEEAYIAAVDTERVFQESMDGMIRKMEILLAKVRHIPANDPFGE